MPPVKVHFTGGFFVAKVRFESAAQLFHPLAMKDFDFEVAVIGGGSGGYAAARTAVA